MVVEALTCGLLAGLEVRLRALHVLVQRHERRSEGVEFGEEVRRDARRLMELPGMEGLEDAEDGEGAGRTDGEWTDVEEGNPVGKGGCRGEV